MFKQLSCVFHFSLAVTVNSLQESAMFHGFVMTDASLSLEPKKKWRYMKINFSKKPYMKRVLLYTGKTLILQLPNCFYKKLKTDLQGVIKMHFILGIGNRRLSITLTKMLCDVIKKRKSKVQDWYKRSKITYNVAALEMSLILYF